MSVLTQDLAAIAGQIRAALVADGALSHPHPALARPPLPEMLRDAAAADLESGAYHRAAQLAVSDDPDLALS